jgi:hypothetical protein
MTMEVGALPFQDLASPSVGLATHCIAKPLPQLAKTPATPALTTTAATPAATLATRMIPTISAQQQQ